MRDDELQLDAREQEALDALLREPSLTEAEWDALRREITRACDAPLAARRARPARRPAATRWLAPLVPLAAAALLLVFLGRDGAPPAELTPAEQALLADVPEDEFARMVSGASDAEELLLMAVGGE